VKELGKITLYLTTEEEGGPVNDLAGIMEEGIATV